MKKFLVLGSLLLLVGAGCQSTARVPATPVDTIEAVQLAPKPVAPAVQEDPFDLTKKVPGTKVFASKNLGIKFTYTPDLLNAGITPEKIKVREVGNKVYLFWGPDKNMTLNPFSAQTIEMFKKDPKTSLEDAIKQKFFTDKSPKDCVVKISDIYSPDINNPRPELNWPDVAFGDVLIPGVESMDDPRMEEQESCAPGHGVTNGVRFFFMNKNVPDKFYFVSFGQESISSDGTPATKDGRLHSWYHSLRIVN